MNIDPFKQAPDEFDWQAQERAFQAARRGDIDADAVDRRIVRALGRAPVVDLPPGFANQVAAMARAQGLENAGLEQRLLHLLVTVFALSAAVVVMLYGQGWAASLATRLPGGDTSFAWSAVAALCLLGNWGLDAIRRLAGNASQTLA